MATKQQDIRALSAKHARLETLINHVNYETLAAEHRRQQKHKAAGVDKVTKEDYERCIEIHGIIDLAVKAGDEWTIIDYKTDALQVGETQEQFESRLREQYSPQIMLYREILQRMGLGEVKEMYLCAIALHGAMIRLGV